VAEKEMALAGFPLGHVDRMHMATRTTRSFSPHVRIGKNISRRVCLLLESVDNSKIEEMCHAKEAVLLHLPIADSA
jgi:hypothetical protein